MAEHDQPEHRPVDPSATDPEQLRQFQQFQQFQEFQRFQEAQGRQAAKPPSPRDWRSLLRWLITRRLVRRLLRLAIIIVLVLFALWLAIDHYFGSSNSGSGNRIGASPVLPQNPKETVQKLYAMVAENNPADACVLFTAPARQAFARDLGASDCPDAVHRAAGKVADKASYVPDLRKLDVSLSGDVTISSCALPVQGGDRLGRFVLRKQPDTSWIISEHYNEVCATG